MYRVVEPISVTDDMLLSSSVSEDSTSAWVSGTSYARGTFVHRSQTHRVYCDKTGGASTTAPELDTSRWDDVRPTNRWACFDLIKTTETAATGSLTVAIAPGEVIDTLCLYAVDGFEATVTMTAAGDVVYTKTVNLENSNPADYWEWCFGGYDPVAKVLFADMPPYAEAHVTVTVAASAGVTVSLGALVVGLSSHLGGTKRDILLDEVDYSTIDTDLYGVTSLTARETASTMEVDVNVSVDSIAAVQARMKALAGKPALWIASDDNRLTVAILLGVRTRFKTLVSYRNWTVVTIKVMEIVA